MSEKKSVAIIGGGIAGLSAAYHLHKDFRVTVYEKENILGGHTRTHDFEFNNQNLRIESGFIAFSRKQYPHFSSILDALDIRSKRTSMSFAVNNPNSGVIYNATTINKLFCQRRNMLNLKFWRMLVDLLRFYRSAKTIIKKLPDSLTIGEYVKRKNFGEMFVNDHLIPMVSALWTCPPKQVLRFPIVHLVQCLHSHGMMSLWFRPKWEILSEGSDSYVAALQQSVQCDWLLGHSINSIERNDKEVTINSSGMAPKHYDAVVLATHADQALSLLDNASEAEKEILGAIEFQLNKVSIHTDDSIMPANQNAWGSWNVEVPRNDDQSASDACTATYWANNLQGLKIKQNIFTSVNRSASIASDKILAECEYHHPIFTTELVAAQSRKAEIDGQNRSYFAGAYWGWGFHEDGARTGFEVAQLIRTQL